MERELSIASQFVPYELAVKLKELGFECDYSFREYDTEGYLQQTGLLSSHDLPHVDAPLYQQAFEWFREKYKLNKTITPDSFNKGLWEFKRDSIDKSIILDKICESNYWVRSGCFKTYEEARQACLEKLIEIVTENK